MTTTQPAALPELPEPKWIALDTPGADADVTFFEDRTALLDFLDEPADMESLGRGEELFTADQMRARDAMWAERLAALQPQPAAADWQTPTTYAQRFTDAVALLCREMPPADMVAGWIDRASDDHRLQDWACERAPAWAQGIGLLDAAHVMADQPTEGVDHEPAQPAAAVSDDEREAFEAWATSCWHDTSKYEGLYKSVQTHALWCAWETRAILALRPQAVPMTPEQVRALVVECGYDHASMQERADFINGVRTGERWHRITAQGAQGGEG